MKNEGKIFEEQWKKSVPDYVLIYRLPDSAQSFGGPSQLRFSNKSPFDFLMWDSNNRELYALEMKTVGGKSISFERNKEDKGEIHYHQIKGLNEWNRFNGIICGLVIEFREIKKTVFIDINQMNKILEIIKKKSFNYDDLIRYKIDYVLIGQERKRTRYIYDVKGMIQETSRRYKNEG